MLTCCLQGNHERRCFSLASVKCLPFLHSWGDFLETFKIRIVEDSLSLSYPLFTSGLISSLHPSSIPCVDSLQGLSVYPECKQWNERTGVTVRVTFSAPPPVLMTGLDMLDRD